MKRLAVVAMGALVASVLAVVPGGNVGADDGGFVLDPDVGVEGDTTATQLDPDDVEEQCVTAEDYNATYTAFLGAVGAAIGGPIPNPEGVPTPTFPTDYEEVAAMILAGAVAPGFSDADAAAAFLASTYLLTFIEIATQDPVGEMSNFDPATGEGEIDVPELDPGLWAVAAVCVEPDLDNVPAALAAGAALLEAEFGEFPVLFSPEYIAMLGALGDVGPAIGAAMFGELMEPTHTWSAPFTVSAEPVVPSPENAAFCTALPQLSPLGDEVRDALAALPEDDGEMSQQEWEDLADWEEIGDELEEIFDRVSELLAEGDVVRAEEVASEWETVTQGLRDARNALDAVDFDLSTESGRTIAGQLREGATAEGDPDPVFDAAVETLTQWFIDNCIPPAPAAPAAPEEEAAREAPAAQPVTAQPTFAG